MRDNLKRTTFLSSGNTAFISELYSLYLKNPNLVDQSWQDFFRNMGDDLASLLDDFGGASWSDGKSRVVGVVTEEEKLAAAKAKAATKTEKGTQTDASTDSMRAFQMIRAYRNTGHYHANLDPLKLEEPHFRPELDPAAYGFSEADWEREISIGGQLGYDKLAVGQILGILKEKYCTTIGYEIGHIDSDEEREWLLGKIEQGEGEHSFSAEDKKGIFRKIVETEGFEQFLHVKYPGTKRFSIEGGETMIVALEEIVKAAAGLGVEEVVLGMPHRGRLNVLTAFMGKPYAAMLSEFQGNLAMPEDVGASGDVKYHLGTSSDRMINGNKVHMTLSPNPSHLEAVNPVVLGRVRAKQDQRGDTERKKVMGILLHGDAAFAGQGIVAESLTLGELEGYRTGGTIHIIVNNQIGFTTGPENAYSGRYPTDLAKSSGIPIFHVNGDDPEAVAYASRIAAEYRQRFAKDAVLDIWCYRRWGHNEGDEPFFTQPVMYTTIEKHDTPREVYAKKLVNDGTMTKDQVEEEKKKWNDFLEGELKAAQTYKPNKADWLEGKWKGLTKGAPANKDPETGVDLKKLKQVGEIISAIPKEIKVHSKIARQLEAKQKMFSSGKGFDWATAEALAFGTLLIDKYAVRLSGQDCQRGTFSHRHSVLVDQETDKTFTPLNNITKDQAYYEVLNSNLSEFAVLGFEYGYSLVEPKCLTLWEGQFGDFANGAQVIIDQFIASAEVKWLRMSGLCMLLPHGYEGQGPEHSSARLERFLQLCAEDNMQVVNITTPANYFHALRRQLMRDFRKPLIVMSPKSLLRHKLAQSELSEMAKGTNFNRIISETEKLASDDKIRKIIFCSGKVYYDLLEARAAKKIDDVAIVRVEQIYPFPEDEVVAELKKYKNAEIVWCQEEPKNMGSWSFINLLIEEAAEKAKQKKRPIYAGRRAFASPAAGYMKMHTKQQQQLIEEALS